jgi:hypothetical protein
MILSSQHYQGLHVFITMLTRVFVRFHAFFVHLTFLLVGLSASMFVVFSASLS